MRLRNLSHLRITCEYLLFSLIYVFAVDHLAIPLISIRTPTITLVDIKGTLFVVISAVLLFFASGRASRRQSLLEERDRLRIAQLAQADKMITLGTLVSSVAHEINNPINFLTLNLPLAKEIWQGFSPILEQEYEQRGDFPVGRFQYSFIRDRIGKMFDGMTEGTERVKGIVATLRDFARPDPSAMTESVDVNQTITTTARLLQSIISSRTDHFSVELEPAVPPINGSSQKLEQVVVNLLQNALESLSGKEKAISISSRFDAEKGSVAIKVMDEGCGIEAGTLKKITEPFFTTKRASGGMGLGLAIASQIVHGLGGTIAFESTVGRGTTATVVLKVEPRAARLR
jgi:signal transduction histidine kinase